MSDAAQVRLDLRFRSPPPDDNDNDNDNDSNNEVITAKEEDCFHHVESSVYGISPPFMIADDFTTMTVLWTPHLCQLLMGTRDTNSPLSLLRGHENSILRTIYHMVLLDLWRCSVTLTAPSEAVGRILDFQRSTGYLGMAGDDDDDDKYDHDYDHDDDDYEEEKDRDERKQKQEQEQEKSGEQDTERLDTTPSRYDRQILPMRSILVTEDPEAEFPPGVLFQELGNRVSDRPQVAFSSCGTVQFPEPADRNVNMMPFVMGDVNSIPEDLRPYYADAIAQCPVREEEMGRVCYLTVMEGWVEPAVTQRRAGLHTESPGRVRIEHDSNDGDACGTIHGVGGSFVASYEHDWGMGIAHGDDDFEGGLYIASNVSGSTRVFNALVDVASSEGIVDSHGGCEHLRPFIRGRGRTLQANELVWMTDRTPHEALPLETRVYRQFFRLVTSRVTLWYEDHSTPNPLGVGLPDYVRVIKGSKFKG